MHLPGYYEFDCRVKIVSGRQALEKIPDLLYALHAKAPLIITDQGVAGAGLLDTVIETLGNNIVTGAVVDDIPPDAPLPVVQKTAGIYREKGCDALIAVGGGSVIDTAKAVNILVSEESDNLKQFSGAGVLNHPLNPLMAIPTTAGTGSEVTLVAVVKDPENHIKIPFVSPFLQPDIAIIDPRMTLTLPAWVTAATAMDALTHAVEAYTCLARNPISNAHALAAIDLIHHHLLQVIRHPGDEVGRLALANAATLAGMAFSNAMVGMVHSLGHSVGGVCGAAHGACMAILLPYSLAYNQHKNSHLIAELLLPLAGEDIFIVTPKHQRTQAVIENIKILNENLHDLTNGRHARYLKEIFDADGNRLVPKEKLPEIARVSLGDASRHYNPEEFDEMDATRVLEAAWEGAAPASCSLLA